MGPIGAQEMFAIVLIALLLFGPKKLPELGRMLGKGLTEFRRAKNELKSTFEGHMRELEREAKLADDADKPKWEQSASDLYSQPYSYNGWSEDGPSATHEPPVSDTTVESHEQAPSEPVSGTVPRSSGVSAPEPVSAAKQEEHAA
jgi:sec-independent protein translocase protein TatA